jgi:hypothetical protein
MNDTNNYAKRTATQVKSLLNRFGLLDGTAVENMGDGIHFNVTNPDLKNLVAAKKAGFIRCSVAKNTFIIKCF